MFIVQILNIIDIAIKTIFEVSDTLHARFDAISRTYEYHIYSKKNPFLSGRAYFIHDPLDIDKMNQAAASLSDHIDFSCFSKSRTQVLTNNCTIFKAQWKQVDDCLIFTISANRFLRNMVRAIVGTLLEVGRNKITQEEFNLIITGKKRADAGISVPACGLYLTEVLYPV
jgi:tRNA pseudouridine38-40 synthase